MSDLELAQSSVAAMADWYSRTYIPKAFAGLPPRMLAVLNAACGGDWRRCVMDADGTVTVYNHPAWQAS